MKSKRKEQITELVLRELSAIIPKHIRSETYKLLNITYIDLNSDLSQVKVFISAMENIDLLQGELNFKIRDIQNDLNKLLSMKKVPKLVLKADLKSKEIDRMESLINNLKINA